MSVAKILIATSVLVALVAGTAGVLAFHQLHSNGSPAVINNPDGSMSLHVEPPKPQFTELGVGETIEWSGDTAFAPISRQAGPYVLEISKRQEDEMTAPVLKLTVGSNSVELEGEMAPSSSVNRITLFGNRQGAVPVILLQSFTGGAHCCNHVQLAGYSAGRLKVVDLGQFDGDEIKIPTDLSGDGVADFVLHDNRFLYAFAPYAQSYAPPQILNVVGGKVVDVSRNPKFRNLFEKEMQSAGENCQPGLGNTGNGACASFVAAAARVGKLDEAWALMLGAYDASVDWSFPTGCWVSDEHGCPEGQEITYKSYPEALESFLRRAGYIPSNWVPPERRLPKSAPQIPDDRTT